MNKQIITFDANEQSLVKTGGVDKYSSNKVSYIEAHFNLGENWSGYDSVRAVWFTWYECISTVLDPDGVCVVPYEVLKRTEKVMVNLVGSISEDDVLTDRLTTYPVLALTVDADAKVCGSNTQPITPSEFEQYVAIVRSLVETVKDIDHISLNSDYTLTIYYSDGTSDTTGSVRGADGNGIESVAKTGTSGLTDTYTITFTDGQTTTFTVTNGAKGDTGNGIASIEKTSTVGLVDTYTITFTDGNTTTFTVTNGEKGDKGDTGEVSQAEFDEAVSDLKSALTTFTGNEKIQITLKSRYIDLSGSSVTMSDGVPVNSGSSGTYSYCLVSCQAGDKFTINGAGGGQTRLWGFISSAGSILSKADANATATDLIIEAPTSSAFLVVHGKTSDWKDSFVGELVRLSIDELFDAVGALGDGVNEISGYLPMEEHEGKLAVFDNLDSGKTIYVKAPTALSSVDAIISNKNLFSGTTANLAFSGGKIVANASYRCVYQKVASNNWYTVSRAVIESNRFQVCATANEPVANEPINRYTAADNDYEVSFFVPSGYNYLFVYLSNQSDDIDVSNYQIELGKTATEYVAHTGDTAQIGVGETVKLNSYSGTNIIYADTDIDASTNITVDEAIESYGVSNGTYDLSTTNLLGNISVKAAKTVNFSDGTQPINEWYLIQDINQNFYMSKDLKSKTFLFHFDPPTGVISDWSFGIDADNNIVAIIQAVALTNENNLDDSVRTVNPYYWLATENYKIAHELDFGEDFKPVGWLGNYGWSVLPNKDILFCEYTRPKVATANVWRISGDITDSANWETTWSHAIVQTDDPSGMKHCHCIQYDFYADVCYFGTGDSDAGSFVYHSTDNGETWTLTYGPNKKKCRMLTFVFTEDYVYWASDSYDAQNHYFFKAERVSDVIDIENAQEISLGNINNQACYGCVYLQSIGVIVMMDRSDVPNPDGWKLTLKGYDIVSGTIVTLGYINPIDQNAGFRGAFIEWYPIDNHIIVGFDPSYGYTGVTTNQNAVCGNLGGITGNGSARINNLILSVYSNSSGYSIRTDTISI